MREESCRGVYASHVLEHLALDEFHRAIENTMRILEKGGRLPARRSRSRVGRQGLYSRSRFRHPAGERDVSTFDIPRPGKAGSGDGGTPL
jgi:hypothetical protein